MKILQGDCIEKMKELEDNSIDTIITDPPYDLISIVKRFGKEGSAPAQYGKDGSFSRLSKGFMGKTWDGTGIAFQKETWKEALRVAKPGATLLSFGGTRTYHRMACAIEDAGWVLKDCIMWLYGSGFPKATDISKQLDKKAGVERKVVGKQRLGGNACIPCKEKGGTYGVGVGTIPPQDIDITSPATPEAKLWNGWKSHGLKPAYEPILVAMKPNEGSYSDNALKWGVSGLNIDGGRIGTTGARNNGNSQGTKNSNSIGVYGKAIKQDYNKGRFPANIILDEEAGKMLDEQSGDIKGGRNKTQATSIFGSEVKNRIQIKRECDSGGASRFFYTAKASKSERNMGCEGLKEKRAGSLECRNRESEKGQFEGKPQYSQNNHPTVKPLKLMEYLCILTKTPTGGIVLDPFMGSGTTGIACKKTGRDFIGIEKEPEYVKIAEARIKSVPETLFT